MQDFLPFIVIGLATGAVYGLAGVGLVLAYKTSGIFNLAYGAIAAPDRLRLLLAARRTRMALGPGRRRVRPGHRSGRGPPHGAAPALEPVGATLKVVATIGLLLIVLGVGELWYGNNDNFPPFLPTSTVLLA